MLSDNDPRTQDKTVENNLFREPKDSFSLLLRSISSPRNLASLNTAKDPGISSTTQKISAKEEILNHLEEQLAKCQQVRLILDF